MEKVFVVQKLTKKLWGAEAAVDAAMIEVSELMRDVLKSRGELKVSSTFAGDIDLKLVEAMQALSAARTAMAGAHEGMSEAQLRLGVRTKMGYEWKPAFAAKEEQATLRDVG